jgi:hypothetical protein
MPVPAVNTTVWSGAVLVMFKVPLVVIGLPVTLIPVPAVAATLVTEPLPLELNVFQSVLVRYPLVDVLAAAILITGVVVPVATLTGAVPVTEVTVPPLAADQLVLVPSVDKTLPELPVCDGNKALIAPVAVLAPVPPLAIGTVPVNTWSSFQSLGRTNDVSASSGTVETLLCLTVIAIIEPR